MCVPMAPSPSRNRRTNVSLTIPTRCVPMRSAGVKSRPASSAIESVWMKPGLTALLCEKLFVLPGTHSKPGLDT